ncbi:MAG: BatA domain-containing protein [bacterium]
MTWLLPSALGIAAAAAIVAVVLHFIARSRPVAEPLPTARFIPERPVHARARAIALTDVPLLLLRVAALMAIGLAVAGPIVGSRGRVARVVLADRSRSVANPSDVRDSARVYLGSRDQLIVFDSAARRASGAGALDSLSTGSARGSLSAALAAAIASAATGLAQADSIEVVFVSPFAAEELDDATMKIRDTWPGHIRVVSVRASSASPPPARVEVSAATNDAVDAGLSLLGVKGQDASIRVVRGRMTAADTAWVRDGQRVLVHWPAGPTDAEWMPRGEIDAIGAVTADGATLVARFPRAWVLQGNTIARWADGEPAAVEHAVGSGCIRDVGILIDQASDVTLRAPFRHFVQGLLAPCGGARNVAPMNPAAVQRLSGKDGLAPASALRDSSSVASRWTPWLLALGAALLVAELALRRSNPARSIA